MSIYPHDESLRADREDASNGASSNAVITTNSEDEVTRRSAFCDSCAQCAANASYVAWSLCAGMRVVFGFDFAYGDICVVCDLQVVSIGFLELGLSSCVQSLFLDMIYYCRKSFLIYWKNIIFFNI